MPDKILVVDDEPDMEALILQRFRKQIKEGTLSFEFAHNGHQALQKLAEHNDVNLVMTDINMPEMDGLTLLSKLKEIDRPLKALVVSAYGDMQNIRSAMNQGSFDFLIKPLDFKDFEITLNKTLDDVHFVINSIETQRKLEKAQDEALRRAEETAKLISEQNSLLEDKVKERTQQLIESYDKLKEQTHIITQEKNRSEELLLNILPEETADELKKHGRVTARHYAQASILFTDFKDFSVLSEKMSPQDLVNLIDAYYKAFDAIIEQHGLEKIKTIGDSYMAAAGLPIADPNNATKAVKAALHIRDFVKEDAAQRVANKQPFFEVRIGVNTGPLVAGVVGDKKFAYDIWGDSVNLAARMESSGEAGRVNISGFTYAVVKDKFQCTFRGKMHVKNKGEVEMYFVDAEK